MLPELCDLIPQIEFVLSKIITKEVLKRSIEEEICLESVSVKDP